MLGILGGKNLSIYLTRAYFAFIKAPFGPPQKTPAISIDTLFKPLAGGIHTVGKENQIK